MLSEGLLGESLLELSLVHDVLQVVSDLLTLLDLRDTRGPQAAEKNCVSLHLLLQPLTLCGELLLDLGQSLLALSIPEEPLQHTNDIRLARLGKDAVVLRFVQLKNRLTTAGSVCREHRAAVAA